MLIEQSSVSKVPVLTSGVITPDILADWEWHALTYFEEKSVANINQVHKVQWGLQDASIQTWITVNSAHFHSLTFSVFMLKFQKAWLKPNW